MEKKSTIPGLRQVMRKQRIRKSIRGVLGFFFFLVIDYDNSPGKHLDFLFGQLGEW